MDTEAPEWIKGKGYSYDAQLAYMNVPVTWSDGAVDLGIAVAEAVGARWSQAGKLAERAAARLASTRSASQRGLSSSSLRSVQLEAAAVRAGSVRSMNTAPRASAGAPPVLVAAALEGGEGDAPAADGEGEPRIRVPPRSRGSRRASMLVGRPLGDLLSARTLAAMEAMSPPATPGGSLAPLPSPLPTVVPNPMATVAAGAAAPGALTPAAGVGDIVTSSSAASPSGVALGGSSRSSGSASSGGSYRGRPPRGGRPAPSRGGAAAPEVDVTAAPVAGDTAAAGDATAAPPPRLSLCHRRGRLRDTALRIALHRAVTSFITVMIVLNAVALALYTPTLPASDTTNSAYVWVSFSSTVVFTVEMVVQLIAFAPVGPGSYSADAWRILDAVVVCLGWIAVFTGHVRLSSLRMLRTLRGLSFFAGTRSVVNTIVVAIPPLTTIFSMVAITVTAFALLGMQLWQGNLRGVCGYADGDAAGTWVVQGTPCSLPCSAYGTATCYGEYGTPCPVAVVPYINASTGSVAPAALQLVCARGLNPDWGQTSFDHVGYAYLTSFWVYTTEGWSFIYQRLWHTWGFAPVATTLFVIHVYVGSFMLLELALAAVWEAYITQTKNERLRAELYGQALAAIPQASGSSRTLGSSGGGGGGGGGARTRSANETDADAGPDANGRLSDEGDTADGDGDGGDGDGGDGDGGDGGWPTYPAGVLTIAALARWIAATAVYAYTRARQRGCRRLCCWCRCCPAACRPPATPPPRAPAAGGDGGGGMELSGGPPAATGTGDASAVRVENPMATRAGGGGSDRAVVWSEATKAVAPNPLAAAPGAARGRRCACAQRSPACLTLAFVGRHVAAGFVATVHSPAWQVVSLLLTVANAVLLGVENESTPGPLRVALHTALDSFAAIFLAELVARLLAKGPIAYLSQPFSAFDAVVVVLTFLDALADGAAIQSGYLVAHSEPRLTQGIRVFLTLRLLNATEGLRGVAGRLGRALRSAGGAITVFFVFLLVFGVIGHQTFVGKYEIAVAEGVIDSVPRLNFNTLWLSIVSVFDITDNENSDAFLKEGLAAVGPPALLFVLVVYLTGCIILLNIFLAILLSNFDSIADNVMELHAQRATFDAARERAQKWWLRRWGPVATVPATRLSRTPSSHQAPPPAGEPGGEAGGELTRRDTVVVLGDADGGVTVRDASTAGGSGGRGGSGGSGDGRETTQLRPLHSPGGGEADGARIIMRASNTGRASKVYAVLPWTARQQRASLGGLPSPTHAHDDDGSAGGGRGPAPQHPPLLQIRVARSGDVRVRKLVPAPRPVAVLRRPSIFAGAQSLFSAPSRRASGRAPAGMSTNPLRASASGRDTAVSASRRGTTSRRASVGDVGRGVEYVSVPPALLAAEARGEQAQDGVGAVVLPRLLGDIRRDTRLYTTGLTGVRGLAELPTEGYGALTRRFLWRATEVWGTARATAATIANSWLFQQASVAAIVWSTLNLTLDHPLNDFCASLPSSDPANCATLVSYLRVADALITTFFLVEVCLEAASRGWLYGPRAYLRHWRILDCFVAFISFLALVMSRDAEVQYLRSLRALRALRPLRFLAKFPSLKLVADAFFFSLPRVKDVAITLLVASYIFAVVGMQAFRGRMYTCNDPGVAAIAACAGSFNVTGDACGFLPTPAAEHACRLAPGGVAFPRRVERVFENFDDIGAALLTVYELVSGENWPVFMTYGTDGAGYHALPVRDANVSAALYYMLVELGLNMLLVEAFAGVIVSVYIALKKHTDGTALLTPEQWAWVSQTRTLLATTPWQGARPAAAANARVKAARAAVFRVIRSPRFRYFMAGAIIANTAVLLSRHVDEPVGWAAVVEAVNWAFTGLYMAEVAAGVFALGTATYASAWSRRFEAACMVGSLLSAAVPGGVAGALFGTFRVLRVFRLAYMYGTVRRYLRTIVLALPAFLNVTATLAIAIFIYAVIGCSLFSGTRYSATSQYMDDDTNFDSFGRAFALLLRCATGENFNGVMHDLAVAPPYCDARAPGGGNTDSNGNCGPGLWVPVTYFASFYTITANILLSLLTAVVMEYFENSKAAGDGAVGVYRLTPDDARHFATAWGKEDKERKLVLAVEGVVRVVTRVHPPLGTAYVGIRALGRHSAARERVLALPLVPDASGCFAFHAVLDALCSTASGAPALGVGVQSTEMRQGAGGGVASVPPAHALPASLGTTIAVVRLQSRWRSVVTQRRERRAGTGDDCGGGCAASAPMPPPIVVEASAPRVPVPPTPPAEDRDGPVSFAARLVGGGVARSRPVILSTGETSTALPLSPSTAMQAASGAWVVPNPLPAAAPLGERDARRADTWNSAGSSESSIDTSPPAAAQRAARSSSPGGEAKGDAAARAAARSPGGVGGVPPGRTSPGTPSARSSGGGVGGGGVGGGPVAARLGSLAETYASPHYLFPRRVGAGAVGALNSVALPLPPPPPPGSPPSCGSRAPTVE